MAANFTRQPAWLSPDNPFDRLESILDRAEFGATLISGQLAT